MGKSSNFIGQPLFNQLIKLISRQKIQEIAQKGGYNRYVKRFDGYSHLVTHFSRGTCKNFYHFSRELGF